MPKKRTRDRRSLGDALWDSYVAQTRVQNQTRTRNTLSAAGRRGAWRRWRREESVIALLPLCDRLAQEVRRMFLPHIDVRDLQQAGALGLVAAAKAYDPARGEFEPYAYFRIRGAMIDSQKRRAYRNEACVSLQAMYEANGNWLPAELERDRGPSPDDLADRAKLRTRLARAIDEYHRIDSRGSASLWCVLR
jgi:RNA polymerase sigma factor (sigma-70 family)